MDLVDNLIISTVLYGLEVWGPSLLELDWAMIERVRALMLHYIIRCKRIVSQAIVQVYFPTPPFRIEIIFVLVSLLQ